MTGFSIISHGSHYAYGTPANAVAVKNSNGTVVQPSKTTNRDTYSPSTATNTFTLETYTAPKKLNEILPSAEWLAARQNRISGARTWAWGTDYYEEGVSRFRENIKRADMSDSSVLDLGFMVNVGGPPIITHSDKMQIQSRLEATGNMLNEQIDRVLKASGVSLGEKERLNFNIDQYGKISITGGLGDSDSRKHVLETMLNSDDTIRSNLYLYQAHKNAIADEFGVYDSHQRYLIENAYDWAHGAKTGMLQEGEAWRFRWDAIEFSYQDGKIFQGNEFPEDRVFSSRLDSLADLGKIIRLDESATKDVQSFVSALETNIAENASNLTKLLNAALKKANLGDITKKITFSQNADGRIVIEGNINDKQKKELAKIINADSELSELIKTQSAKNAVLAELKESITDEPVNFKSYGAWKKHNTSAGFNLAKDSLAVAREQLLKNFLDKNGIDLSDLKAEPDIVLAKHGELGGIKGLFNEIANLLSQESMTVAPAASKPLLAMKQGELVDAIGIEERFGIDEEVTELKYRFNSWIGEYNRVLTEEQSGLAITGFTLTFDQNGRVNVEVETSDGASKSAQRGKQFLATHFIKPDSFQELGKAILDAHDDEHGDVQEHKHSVIIESGKQGYRIESPEADQSALQEITDLTQDIGTALDDFFVKTLSIEKPFGIAFSLDGLLSLENTSMLSSTETRSIKKVLEDINNYLIAEASGEGAETMLFDELISIADRLMALQEARDKIHDKSLLPKEGLRFAF